MYADRSMEVEEMVKAPLEKTENDDLERRGFSVPMEHFVGFFRKLRTPKLFKDAERCPETEIWPQQELGCHQQECGFEQLYTCVSTQ